MARITVEDCLENVNNRFQLVLVATQRARQIMRTGSDPKVPWENDKPTVVALREVAAGLTGPSVMDGGEQEETSVETLTFSEAQLIEPPISEL